MYNKRPFALSFIILLTLAIVWRIFLSPIHHYEYPPISSPLGINELYIPENILGRMTDKALIQAIADYPLLIDLYVMGTVEDGLGVLEKQCSAYKELLSRESARGSLLTDGIALMKSLVQDEKNLFKVGALYDIIKTLYKDIEMNEYFGGDIHGILIDPE